MRIGELSRSSGVGVSLIKHYLREGLLPAGERAGAPNRATYGPAHLSRLLRDASMRRLAPTGTSFRDAMAEALG